VAKQSLVYYLALAKAHVPAELHIYAEGGHAFGLRPTNLPITHWPELAGVVTKDRHHWELTVV
jgi:acetyl esterase/lipase